MQQSHLRNTIETNLSIQYKSVYRRKQNLQNLTFL